MKNLLADAKKQTRIRTASGIFLDMIAEDFFGFGIMRAYGESDTSFRARIFFALFQKRATREALSALLFFLTQSRPVIFEPFNLSDTGAYGSLQKPFAPWPLAYNRAGGYGNLSLPFQAFIKVRLPLSGNFVAGTGYYTSLSKQVLPDLQGAADGGYGQGPLAYGTEQNLTPFLTEEALYALIAGAAPAATIMWTAVES